MFIFDLFYSLSRKCSCCTEILYLYRNRCQLKFLWYFYVRANHGICVAIKYNYITIVIFLCDDHSSWIWRSKLKKPPSSHLHWTWDLLLSHPLGKPPTKPTSLCFSSHCHWKPLVEKIPIGTSEVAADPCPALLLDITILWNMRRGHTISITFLILTVLPMMAKEITLSFRACFSISLYLI